MYIYMFIYMNIYKYIYIAGFHKNLPCSFTCIYYILKNKSKR